MPQKYATEVAHLGETYRRATKLQIDDLANSIRPSIGRPLIAVGSGGSLTVAHYLAWIHRQLAHPVAVAVTPLGITSSPPYRMDGTTCLISAGGRNPDIISALRTIIAAEPRRLVVLCGDPQSQLTSEALRSGYATVLVPELKMHKDGFLATNSLLGFATVLARAYIGATTGPIQQTPRSLAALAHPRRSTRSYQSELRRKCDGLWDRETLVVLHGEATSAAALDLESKFTEAALGSVQVSDYRNFAHGRHNWLAKRSATSGVLALFTPSEAGMAARLLELIPREVPQVLLDTTMDGPFGGLASLYQVLLLVGLAGPERGIDPGTPRIPAFGRRIYRQRGLEHLAPMRSTSAYAEYAAVARKASGDGSPVRPDFCSTEWRSRYCKFAKRLNSTMLKGIVFDYDGTLCEPSRRYQGLTSDVAEGLNRLVDSDLVIGIATGRGQSVRADLQRVLPEGSRERVVIGYYNGAELGRLSEDSFPTRQGSICSELAPIIELLRGSPELSNKALLVVRPMQITIEPEGCSYSDLWDVIIEVMNTASVPANILRSGHSVDIVAPGVSKRAVPDYVAQLCGSSISHVLCVGDQGRWPGNDHELLRTPLSLSVDEVSPSASTCWNLAPPGLRGPRAVLFYMKKLKLIPGGARYIL